VVWLGLKEAAEEYKAAATHYKEGHDMRRYRRTLNTAKTLVRDSGEIL
jgi:hypothetical protein